MAQTDKWRKAKSLFATTLASDIGTGTGDTITLNSTTGLPTDTEITLTFNRVDGDGNVQNTADVERITGTISGSNLINYTRGVDGTTEQAHAGGVVVEYIWNADDWNDAVDSFLEEHNQDGTHKAITTTSVTATSVTATSVTATSVNIGSTIAVTGFVDEDDMASNSALAVPTQQSVKAYIDNTWTTYNAVTPTRASADDPTYVLNFAGVDLTGLIGVGMRVKLTQTTDKYFIVTAISFSTNTTLTLYGGTDYDIADTGVTPISAFYYSPHKAPLGFPLDPSKWSVVSIDTGQRTQVNPTQYTWYNLNSALSIVLPIGAWDVKYECVMGGYRASNTGQRVKVTLSTTNNSETDSLFTMETHAEGTSGTWGHRTYASRNNYVSVTTKQTRYLNVSTYTASMTTVEIWGHYAPTVIRAVCAYL